MYIGEMARTLKDRTAEHWWPSTSISEVSQHLCLLRSGLDGQHKYRRQGVMMDPEGPRRECTTSSCTMTSTGMGAIIISHMCVNGYSANNTDIIPLKKTAENC